MKTSLISLLLMLCPLVHAQKGCALSGNIVVCNGHLAASSELNAIIHPSPTTVYSSSYIPRSAIRRDSRGRIARSSEAKAEFKRQYPCPSTGKGYGRCPGYVIDHVTPLACGGYDGMPNLQWQTTEDGKTKDRIERKNCGGQ